MSDVVCFFDVIKIIKVSVILDMHTFFSFQDICFEKCSHLDYYRSKINHLTTTRDNEPQNPEKLPKKLL